MVYEYPVLVEHRAFEHCHYPWDGVYGRKVKYGPGMCPEAEAVERERARIAEAVEGLPTASKWDLIVDGDPSIVSRAAVLRIVKP